MEEKCSNIYHATANRKKKGVGGLPFPVGDERGIPHRYPPTSAGISFNRTYQLLKGTHVYIRATRISKCLLAPPAKASTLPASPQPLVHAVAKYIKVVEDFCIMFQHFTVVVCCV